MAREFYTKEKKQNHIALWETCGMTRKEYAASNGINEETSRRIRFSYEQAARVAT